MKKLILLIFLSILHIYGNKSETSIIKNLKQQVTNKVITVGDKIEYIIDFSIVSGTIYLPELKLSPFELLSIKDEKKEKDGLINYKFKILLTIYETGVKDIPEIEILHDENGKNQKIKIPKYKIDVKSVLPKDSSKIKLNEIDKNISIYEKSYLWLWILLSILILGIIYLIFHIFKYKTSSETTTVIESQKEAHELAYERLSKLISKQLIQKGEIKRYFFILSEIIREYIGNRYKFDSVEMTSDELRLKIRSLLSFNRENIPLIENFLEDTDIVKFSSYIPETDLIEGITKAAFEIVDKTANKEIKKEGL